MSSFLKFSIIAAAIGVAVWAYKQAEAVTVAITSVGVPHFNKTHFIVPVTFTVTNPAPLPVPIDSIRVDIKVFDKGGWQTVGSTLPLGPLQINPGSNPISIEAVIDLVKVLTHLQVSNLKIMAVVTVTVQGYDLQQSTIKQINLHA